MRLLISGSRYYSDQVAYNLVAFSIQRILTFKQPDESLEIVVGDSWGIDKGALQWAKDNEVDIEVFPADWKRYGRSAGPLRNTAMVAISSAFLGIWNGKSPGTQDAISKAIRAEHINPVLIVKAESDVPMPVRRSSLTPKPVIELEIDGETVAYEQDWLPIMEE